MPSSAEKESSALCMEHLAEHWFHGYTQGCDLCQLACPFNEKIIPYSR